MAEKNRLKFDGGDAVPKPHMLKDDINAVKAAVNDFFSNTTLDKAVQKEVLEELVEDIQIMVDALGDDLKKEGE